MTDNPTNEKSTKLLRRTVIKLTASSGAAALTGLAAADDGDLPDQPDTSDTDAAIVFPEQTTDGESIRVESATLPDGGFVSVQNPMAVHEPTPANRAEDGTMPTSLESFLERTVLGHTEYLDPGTHENFEIELDQAIEGGSGFYWVMVHGDSGDETFNFVESGASEDDAYRTVGPNRLVGDAYLEVEPVADLRYQVNASVEVDVGNPVKLEVTVTNDGTADGDAMLGVTLGDSSEEVSITVPTRDSHVETFSFGTRDLDAGEIEWYITVGGEVVDSGTTVLAGSSTEPPTETTSGDAG